MIKIIHGENIIQSRDELVRDLRLAKKDSHLTRLSAKKLTLASLEQALSSASLFGDKLMVVIEELHSLPKSTKKNQLISLLATFSTDPELQIILWEKRTLTPTMVKKFPRAKVLEYKASSHIFAWLDALSSDKKTLASQLRLLEKAISSDGEQMCFVLIARQIRLLIKAKENKLIKEHPFVIKKVTSQARLFNLEQLLSIHHQLVDIDCRQKTSTNWLSLKAELDLLLTSM